MSKLNKDDILVAISEMKVSELVALVKDINEKFDLPQTVAVASAAPAKEQAVAVEEQDSFNVLLVDGGSNKIATIKALRAVSNLGLKEAKDIVDVLAIQGPYILKEGASKEEAQELKKQFEENGAKIELK